MVSCGRAFKATNACFVWSFLIGAQFFRPMASLVPNLVASKHEKKYAASDLILGLLCFASISSCDAMFFFSFLLLAALTCCIIKIALSCFRENISEIENYAWLEMASFSFSFNFCFWNLFWTGIFCPFSWLVFFCSHNFSTDDFLFLANLLLPVLGNSFVIVKHGRLDLILIWGKGNNLALTSRNVERLALGWKMLRAPWHSASRTSSSTEPKSKYDGLNFSFAGYLSWI